MPIFYQQVINQHTKLAIWKIEEDEFFFSNSVPVQSTITHPHKRLQHFAGRYLLRFLFPNFPYDAIKIASTNKPFLENEAFHFSISHCKDFAAAIVSTKNRVGIDVEEIDKRVLTIVPKFLSEIERADFELLTFNNEQLLQEQLKKATLLWSIKESLFKWYGLGKVDFKTMLKIKHLAIENNGTLNALIDVQHSEFNLFAHYAFFRKLCLSYVVE